MSWTNSSDDVFKNRNSYNIQPLKEIENYEMWSLKIRALLAGNDLVSHVTILNYDIETIVEDEQSVLLSKKAEKAKSIILLNLADESLVQIQHIEKSYDIWEALRNLYASKRFNNDFYLCKEFFNTTLEFCENKMKDYINNLKRISDQLYAKNIKLLDKVIFAWVLDNLIEEYQNFVTIITQTIRVNDDKALNLTQLFVNLIDESKRVSTRDEETALYIKHDKKRDKIQHMNEYRVEKLNTADKQKCSFCKKDNHKTKKCWFKYSKLRFKFKKNKTSVITKMKEIAMSVINTYTTSVNKKLNFDVTEYDLV